MNINFIESKVSKKHGMINMIIGPMFSGKTTELLRLANMYILANKNVVVVKYEKDNRYDNKFASTHDEKKMEAISAVHLKDIFDEVKEHDVICIDEGQFFDDIVCVAEELASIGKHVIVAALDGDFQRRPFETIINLYPLAEKIKKLNAICRSCGYIASFTFRTITSSDLEVIGGQEMYKAVCRECYYEFKQNLSKNKIDENVSEPIDRILSHPSNNLRTFETGISNLKTISLSERRIA